MTQRKVKNLGVYRPKFGLERIEELFSSINPNGTFVPPSIKIEDIDLAVYSFFEEKEEGAIILPSTDKKVPLISVENEEWAEYAKSFDIQDENLTLKLPFASFARNGVPSFGTSDITKYNFPEGYKFVYKKIPRFDGSNYYLDIYKIPHPTPVDIKYQIKLFTYSRFDTNTLDEFFIKKFSARQYYVSVDNHFMPLIVESSNSEDKLSDSKSDRYFIHVYNLLCKGYILDENDTELVESIRYKTVNIVSS